MRADIAIITIREDEFDAVFDRLEKHDFKEAKGSVSTRTYATFSVPTITNKVCEVVLVRNPEQGMDVAQLVASDMIRDWDPQILLVVGIAGGVPNNDFTLGDVIVSSRIDNFNLNAVDQGVTTYNLTGGIHPIVSDITASLRMRRSSLAGWNESASIGRARPLVNLSQAQSNLYGDPKWRYDVLQSLTTQFGESASRSPLPLFKVGLIASSNTLVKDTDIPTQWLMSARSILAIEMESAGVLQATQLINKQHPVMAIRGISDIVGLKRDGHWTSYACQSAGAFTYAFIKAGIIVPATAPNPEPLGPIAKPRDDTFTTTPKPEDSTTSASLNLFISYSVADEKFKIELETHLTMLKRERIIRPWYSQQTDAGQDQEVAKARIDRSQIILLLISPSFLASDELYEDEMMRAMKRHASGDACVIPILIRQADIGKTPFKTLQSLPRHEGAVASSNNRDETWTKIAGEIRAVCTRLLASKNQL